MSATRSARASLWRDSFLKRVSGPSSPVIFWSIVGGDHRICKFGSKSIGFDKVFIKVLDRSPNLEIRAQDSNLRAPSPGIQAQESKPRIQNPGNQSQEWTLCNRIGLQCLWSKPRIAISGFQTQESKPRTPNPGIQNKESKSKDLKLKFLKHPPS